MESRERKMLTSDEMKRTRTDIQELTERFNLITGKTKIYVCGGSDRETAFNSVESYDWLTKTWSEEKAEMREERCVASGFVYDREIFVCGGLNTSQHLKSIESLNVDTKSEWKERVVKLPMASDGHSMIQYEDSVIMTGGRLSCDPLEKSNKIYRIPLNPLDTEELLMEMPKQRYLHGSLIFNNHVLIFGGRTSSQKNGTKNTVFACNLRDKKCKTLASLPYPVSAMATVCYRDKAILIGGRNRNDGVLNEVVMYDVKTGRSEKLPPLNHKREGCAAVIAGNIIVVVGGENGESALNSVECLDLSKNDPWIELPSMNAKRTVPTVFVSPTR